MAEAVIMPKQGQSVESCIITQWFKQKGDEVKAGDLLFAYETDKASFEEEAKTEGILLEIFFEDGEEVPVLHNVAVIGATGEDISRFLQPEEKTEELTGKESESVNEEEIDSETEIIVPVRERLSTDGRLKISPRARSLSQKHHIDLSLVSGTGPHGRIIERDIEIYLATYKKQTPLAASKARSEGSHTSGTGTAVGGRISSKDLVTGSDQMADDFEIRPLSNIRRLIAKSMFNSLQNSAQLTHHLGADARNILALRKKVKKAVAEGSPFNITLNDMICFSAIRALEQFPSVNAHFLGDSVKEFKNIHLGLAVDTERGLMVPAVRNANTYAIEELSKQMNQLVSACRKGNIDPDLLNPEAGSFTVSNLGNYGVEMFTPIINLPQSAILGVNTIVPRPKDLGDGTYGFVPYLGLSLTYDHRSIDGGEATRFLKQIAIEIENLDFEIL